MTKISVTQSNKAWTVLRLQCMKNDLNCLRDVFHKLYNKSNKLLVFGKNISLMIILNFWIFKLSDIIQGIQKHAIQKK